jgi:hypothetical protein
MTITIDWEKPKQKEEGMDAYLAGKAREDNPYDCTRDDIHENLKWAAWDNGWWYMLYMDQRTKYET